jgi:hypothetical protein
VQQRVSTVPPLGHKWLEAAAPHPTYPPGPILDHCNASQAASCCRPASPLTHQHTPHIWRVVIVTKRGSAPTKAIHDAL